MKKGYWNDKQKCQEEALKFNTRTEFGDNSCGAYRACHKNGWLDEVCLHMKIKFKWTKELCHQKALLYTTRKDFEKGSIGAYRVSLKNGWIDEVCQRMIGKPKKLTKEKCQEEANKYTTKIEFKENSSSTYNACVRNKWLNEVCSHMKKMNEWTKQNCIKEALKYNKRSEFDRDFHGAYSSCLRNGWIDEVCSHMKKMNEWTKQNCIKEALKYTTRTEFQKGSGSAYAACQKNGWLDEVYSHMIEIQRPSRFWSKKRCQEEANKYNTRKEFRKNSSSAYGACLKNKWLDEVCTHMIRIGHDGLTEYIKGGWVYVLISPIGEKYIGITTGADGLEERYRQHENASYNSSRKNHKLYNSIKEHGFENFYKEELEFLDYPFRRYELCELERHYIEKYDTFNNGLNSTKGG